MSFISLFITHIHTHTHTHTAQGLWLKLYFIQLLCWFGARVQPHIRTCTTHQPRYPPTREREWKRESKRERKRADRTNSASSGEIPDIPLLPCPLQREPFPKARHRSASLHTHINTNTHMHAKKQKSSDHSMRNTLFRGQCCRPKDPMTKTDAALI